MIDLSSINAVSGILAAIGVLVGVVFAVLQLRDLVRTRKTSLIIQLNPWLRTSAMETLDAWMKVMNLDSRTTTNL